MQICNMALYKSTITELLDDFDGVISNIGIINGENFLGRY